MHFYIIKRKIRIIYLNFQKSIVDANEDDQLAAAIKASLVDTTANGSDSSASKSNSSDTQPEVTRLLFTKEGGKVTYFFITYFLSVIQ